MKWTISRRKTGVSMSTKTKQREVEAQAKEPAGDAGKLVFFGKKAFEMEDFLRTMTKSEALRKGTERTRRVVLKAGSMAVVKTLRLVNVGAKDKLKERIEAIGAMDHKNLLPLRAYYSNSGDDILLVYDLMVGGSLHRLLHEKTELCTEAWESKPLSDKWQIKHRIALGAARAIEYIHNRGPKVFHGNIKSSNVLLTSLDFSNADALVSDYYLTPSPATDPQKADVYSFGVLLLELITGRIPGGGYHMVPAGPQGANLHHELWRFEISDYHDLLRYRDDKKEIGVLFQVATACAARDPDMRPPMSDVRRMIEDLCISGLQRSGPSWSRPQLQPDQVNEVSEHRPAAWNEPDGLLEVPGRVYAYSAQGPNIDLQQDQTLDGYGQTSLLSDHTSSFPGKSQSSLLPPPPPPPAAAAAVVSLTSATLFTTNSSNYSSTSPPGSPSPPNVPPLLELVLLNEKKKVDPQNDKLLFLGNPVMSFSFKELMDGSAEVLGEGTIGTSYKIVLKEGTTVVVKKLRDLASSAEQFQEQMEILGAMDHENINPLRGYHSSEQGKLLLYDYLPMQSLSALLHGFEETGTSLLSWEIRRAIALGAAQGIEYLHSQGPNVYHGSIKSSNVLLSAAYEVQLSDYGLNQLQTTSIHPASEVADGKKADVYSFGLLLLELLLGKAPTNSFDIPCWVHRTIQEELDGTPDFFYPELLSYQHVEELTGLLQVAMACLAQCPGMLSPMSEVRRIIEELFNPRVLSDWDLQPDQINELNHDTATWKLPDEASSVSENACVSDKAFMWANILMLDFETELLEFGAEITSLQMDVATSPAPVGFFNDEEEKANQIAERTKKIEIQELQARDQAAYSIIPSRDGYTSVEENEAQKLPVQSDTMSTSILPLMPPPKLETSGHSAENGYLSGSDRHLESASLNQNSYLQCGITLDPNSQSSILSNLTVSSLSSSGQCQSSLIPLPPPPPPPLRSYGASSPEAVNIITSDPPASAPPPAPLASSLLNEEEVLDLPNDNVIFSASGTQGEQLVPSFQQFQHASFSRMIIEPPKLQAVKQQLSSSLEMSQDTISVPRNGSNVEATAATHDPAQVPETTLLFLEEPSQMEDSPSSTSVSSGYDYDVFLSFRGPDTRSGIVDFLYTSLLAAGIHTYRDNEELRVGDEIGPELQKAIGHSKVSIPIFSKGYASSKWCLNELVQMVECRKTRRQKIMPIFYNVTPSEVRHQSGFYGEAFALHDKQFDNKVISKWKAALKEAGELKGWDIEGATNRREGELVKLIVHKIADELKKAYLLVTKCLVGVENHVKEINRMMHEDSEDIRILGIYGMGGVGKTTLAKIIYNQLSHRFEGCCFLSAIKKTSELKGIECLQNQLVSDILRRNWTTISNVDEGMKTIKERMSGKKVLVLLDDVDERTHLNSLMGKPAWFGLGSRIIITSRNKDIVDVAEVTCPYELVSMDFSQSLQLFCKHAFGSDYPPDDHDAISIEVVKTTGGLPLALEVIGSQLAGKSKDVWDVILKKLRKIPHEEVRRKLKISYDALDDSQKHIFLDIACLYVEFDIRIVLHMWNGTNLFPGEGLRVLQQLSLIKIGEDNKLWMHDQLRNLGREIVRQECNMVLEEQTRLWDHEEALDIVMKKKGSKKIEALSLKLDNQLQCFYANQELERLSNLKYLEVRVVPENWPSNDFAANVQKHLPMLSKLRWLSWHQFPLELKLTNLSLMNIVILDLSWSKFSESWDGWAHVKMARNLKVLNLTGCAHLHRTPDFSANVKLEHLILENCARLVHIDISIRHLKQLVFLNLRFCIKLRKLPEEICNLESLKELLIDGTSVREIPEWRGMKTLEALSACECLSLNNCRSIGNLVSILRLSLENVEITQLPPEIGELVKLEHLSLRKCKLLRRLPDSIGDLESLILLNLSYTHVEELPDSLGKLKKLKVLRICGSSIRIIPSSVGMLEKLEEIDAEFCLSLKGAIPDGFGRLSYLRVLKLSGTRICQVPRLPESLTSVRISTESMKTLPDLSNLINLIDLELDIRDPFDKEDSIFVESSQLVQYPSPRWIGQLRNLESLKLSCGTITALHKDIALLSQLKKLELLCSNLQFLPSLPSNLRCLLVKSSQSMETSIDLSELKELSELSIDSSVVSGIQGLNGLENLKILGFRALNSLERLPDISNLKKLSELHLASCHNLIDVQSISGLRNLRTLKITAIPLLETLPDLSNLKKLTELHLWDCQGLTEMPSLEGLENLIMLKLGELPLLERLPDLSRLRKLTKLHLGQCQNLMEVQGMLDSLEDLCIQGCQSLVKVPHPPSFKKLKSLHIHDCEKLHVDTLRFLDLHTPDRVHGNSTCLTLSKIGVCVCQLGNQFFLPSSSS